MIRGLEKIRREGTAILASAGLATASWLPRWLARAIGRNVGGLLFHLRLGGRKMAETHLQSALGDTYTAAQRRSIAHRVARHFGETFLDATVNYRRGPERTLRDTTIHGLDEALAKIEEARADGRGVVVITGHFGRPDLTACAGGSAWKEGAFIARRNPNRRNHDLLEKIWSGLGAPRRIFQGESIWAVASTLRRNGVIAIAADQDTKRVPGIFVDFFDRPAYTPVAPASLSLKLGSPIVTFFVVREQGAYRAIAGEPIRPDDVADSIDPTHELTSRWTKAVEDVIRSYPEQWIWAHRRWRTTPQLVEARLQRDLARSKDSVALTGTDGVGLA